MSEYERDAAAMTGAALTDSFRVFLVQARQSFVFNAATFPSLPALDAEAGMNPWFWRSALRNGSDGAPLRVGVVTRATGVFATTWNPVYPPALYSIIAWPVIEATMEPGAWELCNPMSGKPAWLTSKPVSSSADAKGVDIPDGALSWNG